MSIRSLFGVNPGQNITKEMLLPYIKGNKEDTNVSFILYCWALRNFPDLDGMLYKMNRLAYQNTKKDTFNPLNPIKNQIKLIRVFLTQFFYQPCTKCLILPVYLRI